MTYSPSEETQMRMMMKSVMAGALVSLATVAVPGAANAVVCAATGATTLAQVIGLGSCTVEDKTFGFTSGSYSGDGFSPTAADVGVVALPSPGAINTNPGIQFNAALSTPLGVGARDAVFAFTVAEAAGTLITDASSNLMGITGNGGIGRNIVDGATLTFPNGSQIHFEQTGAIPFAAVNFAGVPNLSVTDNIEVQPGADGA